MRREENKTASIKAADKQNEHQAMLAMRECQQDGEDVRCSLSAFKDEKRRLEESVNREKCSELIKRNEGRNFLRRGLLSRQTRNA